MGIFFTIVCVALVALIFSIRIILIEMRAKKAYNRLHNRKIFIAKLTADQREIIKAIELTSIHDEELINDLLELIYQRASRKRSKIIQEKYEDDEDEEIEKY